MRKLNQQEWWDLMTNEAQDALDNISNGCSRSITDYFKNNKDNIKWAMCSDDTVRFCFKEIPPKLKNYLEQLDKQGYTHEVRELKDDIEMDADEVNWMEIPGGSIVVDFWHD